MGHAVRKWISYENRRNLWNSWINKWLDITAEVEAKPNAGSDDMAKQLYKRWPSFPLKDGAFVSCTGERWTAESFRREWKQARNTLQKYASSSWDKMLAYVVSICILDFTLGLAIDKICISCPKTIKSQCYNHWLAMQNAYHLFRKCILRWLYTQNLFPLK